MSNSYGFCSLCSSPIVARSRGIPCYDQCENGHIEPAALTMNTPFYYSEKMIISGSISAGKILEPSNDLLMEILAELHHARTKFPGKNVTLAALMEEVGELAKATFEEPRENVRKEAVQVAVMAMRMVLDGDHTFDAWREDHYLDTLTEQKHDR